MPELKGRVGGRPAKLTASQRQAVLNSLATGMSQSQIAESFRVSRSTIARLKTFSAKY